MTRALTLLALLFAAVPAAAAGEARPGPSRAPADPSRAVATDPPGGAGSVADEPGEGGVARPRSTPPDSCGLGPISFLFIDNHSIFDTTDPSLDRRFAWAYGVANSLHFRTRRSVIERELLFVEGDCYDPALLEESERLLRGHDFLSHVDVFGVAQPDGSWHVVVDTQDEWSTQVDLRVGLEDGLVFNGARLEERNLLGTGQSVGFFYIERDATRDYGVSYSTPQLAGTRWDLRLAAGRTRVGTFVRQAVAYPFVGEVGRWAARQGFSREDRLFDYVVEDGAAGESHLLLPLRDKAVDLAVVGRFGEPGRLTLLGAALAYEELSYHGRARFIQGDDFGAEGAPDSAHLAAVRGQMDERENVRLFLVVGQRNVAWVQRRGLDALKGEQDVRLGSEVELAVGRTIRSFTHDNDVFGALTLQAGVERGAVLGNVRARFDARYDYHAREDRPAWQDLGADAELLAYWRPPDLPRHTFLFRAAATGGWRTTTPFQLTLGGERYLRGYAQERLPGGKRLVLTAEDRVYLGWPLPDVLDLGGTAFLDVGRVWPGDVPFGIDSGWRASVGAGLRASFPAGGRTTYRLDLAVPVSGGIGWSDVRVLFSIGEVLGLSVPHGDPQVVRSRRPGPTGELFHFPN